MTDEMDFMLLTPAPALIDFWRVGEQYRPSSAFDVRHFWTCFWIEVKVFSIAHVHVKHVLDLPSLDVEMAESVEIRDKALQEVLFNLLSECEHPIKLTGSFPIGRKRGDWGNYYGIPFIHEHFRQALNATPIVDGTE
jgi:hypothetical protein